MAKVKRVKKTRAQILQEEKQYYNYSIRVFVFVALVTGLIIGYGISSTIASATGGAAVLRIEPKCHLERIGNEDICVAGQGKWECSCYGKEKPLIVRGSGECHIKWDESMQDFDCVGGPGDNRCQCDYTKYGPAY